MNSITYATKRGTTALTIPQFADLLKHGHWDINVHIDPKKWCLDKTSDYPGVDMWLSFAGGFVEARRENIIIRFNWFAPGGCGFSYAEASKFDDPTVDPDDMGYAAIGVTLVSDTGGRINSKQLIRKALNGLNGLSEATQEAIAYKLKLSQGGK